jgi:hypothetical protein
MLSFALLILIPTLVVPAFAELEAPSFDGGDNATSDMKRLAKSIGTMDQGMSEDKRLMIADNINLTGTEAKEFWPIYEAYQKELHQINKRLAIIINTYALEYSNNELSNKTAKKLLNEYLAIELAEVKLKQLYVPKFEKVLPAIKVARYIQLETKTHAVLYYELAGRIPLIE